MCEGAKAPSVTDSEAAKKVTVSFTAKSPASAPSPYMPLRSQHELGIHRRSRAIWRLFPLLPLPWIRTSDWQPCEKETGKKEKGNVSSSCGEITTATKRIG